MTALFLTVLTMSYMLLGYDFIPSVCSNSLEWLCDQKQFLFSSEELGLAVPKVLR